MMTAMLTPIDFLLSEPWPSEGFFLCFFKKKRKERKMPYPRLIAFCLQVIGDPVVASDEDVPDEKHVSFVNGINTRKGGKHVDKVVSTIIGDFCELAAKKKVNAA